MKYLNKLATACCTLALGFFALTGCEGGDIFTIDSPDWITEKVDSIANSKNQNTGNEEELVGMNEDVYTIGNADYSSGWWASFSKYYVIPDGQKWNAVFNLHINPSAETMYYQNFALVITNDVDRGGDGYKEYGAIRYDATNDSTAFNSQWGDHLFFKFAESDLPFSPTDNIDANIQKMAGKVTLTVDRSKVDTFAIKMTNGTVTKTYTQPYKLPNINADASNTNIRCFLVPEGSYIDFLQSNIEPIGGYTSADDKSPLSMELQNVPAEVGVGTPIEEAMAGVTATVTFEEGVSKSVTAAELQFQAIPDMETPGVKTLVAIYNKTFKGENCDKPVMASAQFEVVNKPVSVAVTALPARQTYVYYAPEAIGAVERSLVFDPTGMEVTATYADGSTRVLDNSKLTYTSVPAKVGNYQVTITAAEGITTTVDVAVAESPVSAVTNSTSMVGAPDNSSGWWSAFSDDFNVPAGETRSLSFTNYSSMAGNWNNYVVILRKADMSEYAVVRADNYGWGAGYDGNPNLILSGGQPDWATWLAGMDGAKVTVYVTNCGNGSADIQVVMNGTDGTTSIQYYMGIIVDSADLNFALTVDGSHYVFE